ncbi:sirohydrochlorin chelatase [Streptomyces sp. ST2-7A]|uniref:sirohydrochlorin chelatase n=1 Tax=Streptomyces sp. ST2-7A TaxID=2907214 RepID=UPI001F271EDF|nr:CbiX/SirB N-terminal domain-containing protein [Streptomyces sp. ST2-7A]MCE7079129.1 sirohydrochlorin chelatase [Streptomyces sp. ST2-7A]
MSVTRTAPTLVAVAHGSPDPRARESVLALLRRVRAMRRSLRVELGHLETDEPLLGDTLARLRGEAVLVPLLFGRGYHVKHDIPSVLSRASHLDATVAACLGPHPLLVEALYGRLLEAGYRGGAVVLASAGSRDPESAAGTRTTAAMLSHRLGGAPVVPAYASAASPTVAEAVELLRSHGHRGIALSSCFTAPGFFATRCAEAAPGIVAEPLGAHASLARLLLHRFDRAAAALPVRALHHAAA